EVSAGWGHAEFEHALEQIVAAVAMVVSAAQQLVAPTVTGRHEGVMHAGGGVFDQCQDGMAGTGDERVADDRIQMLRPHARGLHAHELFKVIGIPRPAVDDLGAVGVDDAHRLPGFQAYGFAM
nr:hypothetical protein [Tanacetum cinerariifolium]